ncbi:MAG TPA: HAMP domain-containing histidine kinase [Rhodobacteraceae bacterium]|nr:HAMP domain-containing histidine kinase [Paracoccaceae bacterium]
MHSLREIWKKRHEWFDPTDHEQRIRDYLDLAGKLIWQRQGSFLAGALLAAYYFDPVITAICYAAVFLTELLDQILAFQAKAWDGKDPVMGRRLLKRIAINTVISAVAISIFIVSIAMQQTSGGHFTPLIFLFSASLFAAMYNSQMIGILLLRLSIYAGAFMFIAFLDVVRYRPPLGSNVWLEFFTIIFVLYFIFDISLKFYRSNQERTEQLKLIKDENEKTKAAYEVKSQFLSTVSHELRTPLTSIKGSLDLVNGDVLGKVPDNLKPALAIAAKNSQRLANLIDDLLDLQKMEAGEMNFNFETMNVNELVKEAVESTTGYAAKLGIHVTTILPARELMIRGDHSRLIQVMNNLLSNALKFSNEGGSVRIQVSENDNRVRISVQDDGIGIPDNARDKVFGKFSQIDSSDIRKVGGTGLGLNITKQIVERHDGMIDYESGRGAGTTFFVEFDQVQDDKTDQAETVPMTLTA